MGFSTAPVSLPWARLVCMWGRDGGGGGGGGEGLEGEGGGEGGGQGGGGFLGWSVGGGLGGKLEVLLSNNGNSKGGWVFCRGGREGG